ncbi:hypothetical protein EXIGLDRAFT_782894 [Exidia glandulosa HHB12029]|uniref:Uncharacterized protein n=1 Tax=Exidia glandulosa HHB12029 TaxID=1314781 RepID=A0A165Z3K0_EXIGL|nr:hypothetical protein EXIGLDRAFT_782894 [Exidia glandulosa HHB12029]
MMLAFDILKVPGAVIKMYDDHFNIIMTAEDFLLEWAIWRMYDLRRRALVKGDEPADISTFDAVVFRQCQNAVQSQIHAEMRATSDRMQRRPAQSNAPVASGSGAKASSSRKNTGGDMLKSITYSCCLVCGSKSHIHDKDVIRKDCDTRWLVFDGHIKAWRTPDTRALICWSWNSIDGCSKAGCRFATTGHRCSLCGGAHGCHSCPV